MKEECKKTAIDTPTMKMERESIKVSKDQITTESKPATKSGSRLEEDPVDTHVFSTQVSTSTISLANEELEPGDIPRHVNVNLIYEVKESFAEGAQGSIHTAEDKHLGREVVVKKLKENSMRRSFIKEAQLTAQLDHPAIIPIYSLNSDKEKNVYFSMKKVNGVTLTEYLNRVCDHHYFNTFKPKVEQSSLNTRLEHFIKICEAVQYAHSKRVIHRDLKPDNVMIGESREVYVMDWGIAYCMDDPENKKPEVIEHMRKTICGSPGYIDPHMVCDPFPNQHTDVYSLGMILHEVCTLQRGFSGFNTNELFEQAIRRKFPEVKHRFTKGSVAPELKAIIEKARNPDVLFRYSCVEELSEDIRRFLRNDEVSSLPDKPFRKVMRWAQKNPHKITTLVITVITLLSSIAIYSLIQQNKTISEAREREGIYAEFQSRVAEKAHVIDNQLTKIEQLIAQLGEQLLSKPELRDKNTKLYSSADFDDDKTKPIGTIYSSIFGKEVNVSTPVYKIAPDTKYYDVEDFVQYLFSFKNQYLEIMLKSELYSPSYLNPKQVNEEKILLQALPVRWLYCGLENGVFVSYPGKGGYPEEYDHRDRPWYIESKEKRGIRWVQPYYDINGLGLVLPCTMSLYNSKDEFGGVLALDLTLDFIAEKLMFNFNEDKLLGLIESFILNGKGEIIVSSTMLNKNKKTTEMNNRSIERKLYPNAYIQNAVKKDKNTLINTGEYIYVINRIPTLDWFYVEKCEAEILLKSRQ